MQICHPVPHRSFCSVLLCVALSLTGCSAREPIRLDQAAGSLHAEPGLLWTFSTYKRKQFERWNYAAVTRVDGEQIPRETSLPPVILAPGRHKVEVLHERDSLLCGYFGCLIFKQALRTLDLDVAPGHSYLPLAGKYCGQNWIWIVALGDDARAQLAAWLARGTLPYSPFDPVSLVKRGVDRNIVAGEAPPASCESEDKP